MFISKNWSHRSDKKWLRKINRSIGFPRFSHFFPFVLYIVFIFAMLLITFRTLSMHKSGLYAAGDATTQDKHRKYESPKQLSGDFIKSLQHNRSADTNRIVNSFKGADTDADNMLTSNELALFINQNIAKHVSNAKQSNRKIFQTIDTDPKDGFLTWNEYHTYFLKKNGFNEAYARNHNEKKHSMLNRKLKETIMKDKALWLESAKYDADVVTLNEEEFLLFRHPEASALRLTEAVDDMMRQFDIDGNDLLSLDEFIEVLPNDANVPQLAVSATVKERKEEFTNFIDVNGNGNASRDELLQYIDPRNFRHAKTEAKNLFSIADTNNDGQLAMQEVFNKFDVFLASKMISAFDALHNEF